MSFYNTSAILIGIALFFYCQNQPKEQEVGIKIAIPHSYTSNYSCDLGALPKAYSPKTDSLVYFMPTTPYLKRIVLYKDFTYSYHDLNQSSFNNKWETYQRNDSLILRLNNFLNLPNPELFYKEEHRLTAIETKECFEEKEYYESNRPFIFHIEIEYPILLN